MPHTKSLYELMIMVLFLWLMMEDFRYACDQWPENVPKNSPASALSATMTSSHGRNIGIKSLDPLTILSPYLAIFDSANQHQREIFDRSNRTSYTGAGLQGQSTISSCDTTSLPSIVYRSARDQFLTLYSVGNFFDFDEIAMRNNMTFMYELHGKLSIYCSCFEVLYIDVLSSELKFSLCCVLDQSHFPIHQNQTPFH